MTATPAYCGYGVADCKNCGKPLEEVFDVWIHQHSQQAKCGHYDLIANGKTVTYK